MVFVNIVFAPLDKFGEELEKSQQTVSGEVEEEDAIFLPFPGTIKEIEQKPYRGTDPEWQEFLKFSKDIGLNKKVKSELLRLSEELD